jgi:hypothetical protein
MTVYGDLLHVKRMLRPNPALHFDTDVNERLTLLQAAVSAAIEQRLGRTFGVPAEEESVHLLYGGRSPVLLLPYPARSITSVSVGGRVVDGALVDGTVLDSEQYVAYPISAQTGHIWGLRLLSGAAWGYVDAYNRPLAPVEITGDFVTTDDDDEVPADLDYAATRLIQLFFQMETASASGYIGPDGQLEAPRDPWSDPLVKSILGKYTGQSQVVVI